VTWNPPSLNTDGSALTNSASFLVTYGTSASNLNQSVSVPGGTTTSKTIDGLSAGTYYFAVTAVNAAGVASTPTNPVARTLP
jgi:predicted phage tail protein